MASINLKLERCKQCELCFTHCPRDAISFSDRLNKAGLQFYAGYPITPSTEIMEYLSDRLPELGRSFVQAESEVSGINMVMGGIAILNGVERPSPIRTLR